MDSPLTTIHACSVQPLEDFDGPRAPLLRQVSLDEERRDECAGHWRPVTLDPLDPDQAQGVRLFRALVLQHLRSLEIRPPSCAVTAANPVRDPRDWWREWQERRALERAARRFRSTEACGRLERKAATVPLLSLDEVAFEDIMQELCQECARDVEQRALCVLVFLCAVCARAADGACGGGGGGWCRAADWAVRHVVLRATPWALRHGGWGALARRVDAGSSQTSSVDDDEAGCGVLRLEEHAVYAAAAAAAIAILLYCRHRLRPRAL